MNFILQLIAQRERFLRAAAQNCSQIRQNNEAQPPEARLGNEMLAHLYDAFIKASVDKTKILAVCETLNRQGFTSYACVNTQIQGWADHLVKRHIVSDEYIVALGLFRTTLKNYLDSLHQLERQSGFTLLDNIDLLTDYVQKLQDAKFSPTVIIEACKNARDSRILANAFQIPDAKSLFYFHDSLIEFISYSAYTTDEEKCRNLTKFFKTNFPLTTMVDHIERQCRQLNSHTLSWCILWNVSSFAGASRTPINEQEHKFHEFNY